MEIKFKSMLFSDFKNASTKDQTFLVFVIFFTTGDLTKRFMLFVLAIPARENIGILNSSLFYYYAMVAFTVSYLFSRMLSDFYFSFVYRIFN